MLLISHRACNFIEERVQSAIESLKAESGKQHVWVPPSPRYYALHFGAIAVYLNYYISE